MRSKFLKPFLSIISLGALGLVIPGPVPAQTLPATLTVNAGKTLTTFIPLHIFGNNVAYWVDKAANLKVQPQVEAAGNYFLRYPGGSASDDYHWNGKGTGPVKGFDAQGDWVPSDSQYAPGFSGVETYRGTGSSYGIPSHLTDGKADTSWLSCADTDFPNHQWVYFDLTGKESTAAVDAVTLLWGKPYASSFQKQYWARSNGWPSPATSPQESDWVTTSAGDNVGKGGTQGVTFNSINARYIRVLMTASSAGEGGAYAMAEFYAFNGKTQVTKNADNRGQTGAVASSTDPACSYDKTPNFDFESYMTYLKSFKPNAVPIVTVNFGTGTPQEAAAWVHYANVVKKYGVQYWEIGNELDGDWETGGPLNANDYARRYIEFYEAMKKEDPTILVTGPVAAQPGAESNAYDGKTFIQTFLHRLAQDTGGSKISYVDGLSYHCYPYWQNSDPVTTLGTPAQIKEFHSTLDGWLKEAGASTHGPVLLTEYNSGNATVMTVKLVNALWLVNWLGEYIHYFGDRGYANMWDVLNGGNLNDPQEGDHAYLQAEKNKNQYQERAHYWAMQMMARDWAIPGDKKSHRLVSVDNNTANLAAYADYRPDGILSLIVVNKDNVNAYQTTLNFKGFTPISTANTWSYDSAHYAWETATKPYHADPDTAPTTAVLTGVSKSFSVTLKPYSITVFQFTKRSKSKP